MISAIVRRLRRRLFPPREVIEGYEQAELVETIFQKTKAHDPRGDWTLMAGVSTVLDFGGGCGLHYKMARRQTPDIRWAVVETPAMAARASEWPPISSGFSPTLARLQIGWVPST